jgi:hypothetical protein
MRLQAYFYSISLKVDDCGLGEAQAIVAPFGSDRN